MPDSTGRNVPVDLHRLGMDTQEDPLHEASQPGISLGEAAVSGGLWTALQVVAVKLVSLGGTLILMHLLSPDVYGIATLALSVHAMVTVLQPFTMGDVIVARTRDLDRISGTAHRICFVTSLFFALAIAASGPWVANHYRSPALVYACAWVALRPLSDWVIMLPLTRLRARLRFRAISTLDTFGLTGATVSSVLMAWARLGYISLLLPQIVFTAIRAWLYRRASPAPRTPAWLKDEARPLFHKFVLSGLGQYVHGGLISMTPLIIGTFTGKREVGWYTIAFTMSAQINAVVGFGMGLVLQPIFAQMGNDLARQAASFLRACRLLATLAMPVCLVQAVLAPAAFRLLMPERWAGAIVLAQILSLGQAFFFSINPAIGLLTAQGRFGTFMLWQTAQFVLVVVGMLAAGFYWREAPLVPIVLVGGLYHVVSAPVGVWIAVRRRGASLGNCLGLFLRPLLLAGLSVLPVSWVLASWAGASRDLLSLLLVPPVSLAIFVMLVRRFDRAAAEDCGRLAQAVTRLVRRHRAGQP